MLAYEITRIIHGKEEADKALDAAKAAFGGAESADKSAIPSLEISKAEIDAGINVVDLFAMTNLCASKAEARRLVTQGGALVSDKKITEIDTAIDSSYADDNEIMLKAGKKRYFRLIVK